MSFCKLLAREQVVIANNFYVFKRGQFIQSAKLPTGRLSIQVSLAHFNMSDGQIIFEKKYDALLKNLKNAVIYPGVSAPYIDGHSACILEGKHAHIIQCNDGVVINSHPIALEKESQLPWKLPEERQIANTWVVYRPAISLWTWLIGSSIAIFLGIYCLQFQKNKQIEGQTSRIVPKVSIASVNTEELAQKYLNDLMHISKTIRKYPQISIKRLNWQQESLHISGEWLIRQTNFVEFENIWKQFIDDVSASSSVRIDINPLMGVWEMEKQFSIRLNQKG